MHLAGAVARCKATYCCTGIVSPILDKCGILNAKGRVTSSSDPSLELLADTATDYVELLKKMKRKGEASKLEARIRQVVGKNYTKKRQS